MSLFKRFLLWFAGSADGDCQYQYCSLHQIENLSEEEIDADLEIIIRYFNLTTLVWGFLDNK